MNKNTIIAFDVFGTLVDTAGIAHALSAYVPDANAFAARWRDKQLEYTFRRTLMQHYQNFAECTRESLNFVCSEFESAHNITITQQNRDALMLEYLKLPAFADAARCLSALSQPRYAFSNGAASMVQEILQTAGLLDSLNGIISADDVKMFKPAPQVYAHFINKTNGDAANTWLISGNPFDIMGARAAGWQAVWVQRNTKQAIFDPWHEKELMPTATISTLDELPDIVA